MLVHCHNEEKNMAKKLHFETLQLHVGQEQADPATDSRAVPIYQTTSYVFHNSQHAADRFGLRDAGNIYGRLTNSTQDVLEKRIAALEGGVAALAVASGAAAITYTIQALAQAGDHIVSQKTIYGGSYNLLAHTLKQFGVETTFVDAHNLEEVEKAIKPNTKAAIRGLKEAGVKQTVMLTGDAKRVADYVAKEIGVDVVKSELLPADKVTEVEKLLEQKGAKEKLAFVGDGINDAPVLSRADLGIAMGALGSDAAIEAADIVLMDDDPSKISLAMKISRKTIQIVHQNIVLALAVKFVCLALSAIGFLNMWWAIFADVGVMIIAVLNATRALKYKD